MARITTGWEIDTVTGKKKQKYATIGYATTKQEGIQMLADLQYVVDTCDKKDCWSLWCNDTY